MPKWVGALIKKSCFTGAPTSARGFPREGHVTLDLLQTYVRRGLDISGLIVSFARQDEAISHKQGNWRRVLPYSLAGALGKLPRYRGEKSTLHRFRTWLCGLQVLDIKGLQLSREVLKYLRPVVGSFATIARFPSRAACQELIQLLRSGAPRYINVFGAWGGFFPYRRKVSDLVKAYLFSRKLRKSVLNRVSCFKECGQSHYFGPATVPDWDYITSHSSHGDQPG
jgi:hypothetical protein